MSRSLEHALVIVLNRSRRNSISASSASSILTTRSPDIPPRDDSASEDLRRILAPRGCCRKSSTAPRILPSMMLSPSSAEKLLLSAKWRSPGSRLRRCRPRLPDTTWVRPKCFPLASRRRIRQRFSSGYDQDVLDSRIDQRLDGVINHWLVVDRKQMFIGNLVSGKSLLPFHRLVRRPSSSSHDTIRRDGSGGVRSSKRN